MMTARILADCDSELATVAPASQPASQLLTTSEPVGLTESELGNNRCATCCSNPREEDDRRRRRSQLRFHRLALTNFSATIRSGSQPLLLPTGRPFFRTPRRASNRNERYWLHCLLSFGKESLNAELRCSGHLAPSSSSDGG